MSLAMLLTGAAAGGGAVLVPATHLWWRTRRLTRALAGVRTDLTLVRYDAEHDPLTDLPNRRALYAYGAAVLARAYRSGQAGRLVVALVDVDEFKKINDTHGHTAGDLVLRDLARRLAERVAGDGIAARLGGDEFAVLAQLRDGEDPRELGMALCDTSDAPVDLDDVQISFTLSVGVVPVPATGREVSLGELLARADAAMYRAKHSGLTAVYDPQLDDHSNPATVDRPALRTRDLAAEFSPADLPAVA